MSNLLLFSSLVPDIPSTRTFHPHEGRFCGDSADISPTPLPESSRNLSALAAPPRTRRLHDIAPSPFSLRPPPQNTNSPQELFSLERYSPKLAPNDLQSIPDFEFSAERMLLDDPSDMDLSEHDVVADNQGIESMHIQSPEEDIMFNGVYGTLDEAFDGWNSRIINAPVLDDVEPILDVPETQLDDVVFGVNLDSQTTLVGKLFLHHGHQHVEKVRTVYDNVMYATEMGWVNDFDGTRESGAELWFADDRKVYYRWYEGNDWGVHEDGWMVYEVYGGWDLRAMGQGAELDPSLGRNDERWSD
jgi:hypothetical protein